MYINIGMRAAEVTLQTSTQLKNIKHNIMDACTAVEREVDKVLSKFGLINEHAEKVLRDLINHIESLKKELEEGNQMNSIRNWVMSIVSNTLFSSHHSCRT